jgi:hypothetical protein
MKLTTGFDVDLMFRTRGATPQFPLPLRLTLKEGGGYFTLYRFQCTQVARTYVTSHLIGATTGPAYMDCHSVPGR